jgi:hypothetical protein
VVSIGEVIKDYQDDCVVLRSIDLGGPRSENLSQDLENVVSVVRDIKRILEKWTVGREELNKILEEKRNARWYQFVTGYCAVASTVAAVIAAICATAMFIKK